MLQVQSYFLAKQAGRWWKTEDHILWLSLWVEDIDYKFQKGMYKIQYFDNLSNSLL